MGTHALQQADSTSANHVFCLSVRLSVCLSVCVGGCPTLCQSFLGMRLSVHITEQKLQTVGGHTGSI